MTIVASTVQERIDTAIALYPTVAAIMADHVHGGWEGNEMAVDALLGSDAELRAAIWQYSLAVKYSPDPRYFRKNCWFWYNLLCAEQVQRTSGGKCDALTEYRCSVWRESFRKAGGIVRVTCQGCEKGIAHKTEMSDPGQPVYAPIDGGIGA